MFDSERDIYRFVTVRAHAGATPLLEAADKELFLNQLAATRKRFRVAVAGYAVLDDHAHLLLISAADQECGAIITDLRGGFQRAWRAKSPDAPTAPLWAHGLEVREVDRRTELRAYLDFIHYDPVRHGLVARAADYPWSSLPARVAQGIFSEDWATSGPPAGVAKVLGASSA